MSPFSFSHLHCWTIFFFTATLLLVFEGGSGATFTLVNMCDFTIWPGILGNPQLDSTGFELTKGGSRAFQAPTGWSGRFWARTGCTFDSTTGQGVCNTADCNSGQIECNGAAATPPATLAEFTIGSAGSQSLDFYDVSLVDGYNLPMIVEASHGSAGACASTGCVDDLNSKCPAELRVEGGAACRSACEAFGTPEYCCKGAYDSPATCKPSVYSQVFKSACPKSYSYAYDDATSTFTCAGADYTITFCPNLSSTLKSARDSSPDETGSTVAGQGIGSATGTDTDSTQQAEFENSWLANLATSKSTRSIRFYFLCKFIPILVLASLFICY